MAVGLLLFALLGCFLGILTGFLPGLHVNTVALIALGMPFESTNLMVLIAGMAVVHSFVDFVPSILFGAPDSETFLGVLPGHRMLLKGNGILAVKLTIAGGLFAGIASIAIAPLFVLFAGKTALALPKVIPFALIGILAAMVLGEKGKKRIAAALLVVSLSSALGMLALKSTLPLSQPLFCLAAGFFGASMLLNSVMKKPALGEQKKIPLCIEKPMAAKNSLLALFGAWIVSLMPSIGPSQAAFIVRNLVGKMKDSSYLVVLGGINTANIILSFFVLFALGKARTGSAAAISQLAEFGFKEIFFVAAACLLAIGFGAIAADLIAANAVRLLQSIDYRKVNALVLALVTGLVLFFSGPLGLGFYATAAAIGLVSINAGIKRTNTMAFLMVPTIFYYSGIV